MLTELQVRTGLGTLVCVQHQDPHFEEVAVGGDIEAAHFVEAVTVDQQYDQSDSSPEHLDVMHYPIDGWVRGSTGWGQ